MVRTLRRFGKLENLKTKVKNYEVGITDLIEGRWTDKGERSSVDFIMFYSCAQRGVAVVMRKETMKCVKKFEC